MAADRSGRHPRGGGGDRGRDARTLSYASLRRAIGYVSVEEAAKPAEVHDFVMAMPAGYQTVVGERAVPTPLP